MEFWDFITDPYSWWASEARYYILLAIVFVFLVCWKLWSMTKGTFEIGPVYYRADRIKKPNTLKLKIFANNIAGIA